jgi:hypothetical protein
MTWHIAPGIFNAHLARYERVSMKAYAKVNPETKEYMVDPFLGGRRRQTRKWSDGVLE